MKVRYTNTIDDLVSFNRHHLRTSPAYRRLRWRALVLPPAIALAISSLLSLALGNPAPLALGALFSILYAIVFRLLFDRRVEASARTMLTEGDNKSVLCEHTLEITDDALVETTAFSVLHSRWPGIERVDEDERFAFIYVQASAAHIVPRSLADGDYAAFVSAVRARLSRA